MIIIDTREQRPLWDPSEYKIKKLKLDEGDYTTEELLGKAHAERKSPIDLYGSLIQNHDRFSAELQRAIEKDLSFAVFVECSEKKFVSMKFAGASRLKLKPETLAKVVNTFTNRYPIEFIWCKDREDLRKRLLVWFAERIDEFNLDSGPEEENSAPEEEDESILLKIGDFETEAEKRTFSSGKEGYGFYGKVDIGGKRHQVTLNAVNIDY